MPTYKNSAGNSGISNEYYNWRYFNSNLQKLQKFNAPKLNIAIPNVPTEVVNNYADVAWNLLNMGVGAAEAYQNYSYKLAEDYINKVGIDGYNKAMKENNVPIQDNPVAMQHLRYLQGKTLSELNQLDFQTKLERGQFIGKSPLEVEKAMLDSKIEAPKDVEEYTPYVTQNDMFFNQGYWEDTPTQKEQNYLLTTDVNNKYYKEEAVRTFTAKIGNLIDSGASPQAIENTYKQLQDSMGIYFSPAETTEFMKGMLVRAGNTAWGGAYIDKLATVKAPGSDKTYGEILGADYIKDLKISSENTRYSEDLVLRTYDLQNISKLVADGNWGELSRIATEEFDRYGTDTFRGKLYWQAASNALTQQKALAKQQAKENQVKIKGASEAMVANIYNERLRAGVTDFREDTNDKFWSEVSLQNGGVGDIKLTKELIYQDFKDKVESGYYSIKDIAEMADNDYVTYNPAKDWLKRTSSNVYGDLEAQLNAYANGSLKIFEIPEGLGTLSDIYRLNPSSLPLSSDKEHLMNALIWGNNNGVYNFNQAMRAMGELRKNKDTKVGKELEALLKRESSIQLDLPSTGGDSKLKNTPSLRGTITNMTAYNMLITGMSPRDALELTHSQLADRFYQVGANMIPKNFFSNPYLANKYTGEIAEDLYRDAKVLLDEKHLQDTQVDFQVNPATGDLEVYDSGSGEVLKTYSKNWIYDKGKEKAAEVEARVKAYGESLANRQTQVENIYRND